MKKRVQMFMSDDAWNIVEALTKEANVGFDVGKISHSDVINELVLVGKVDIKTLQMKHTDFKKSLRSLASKSDIDLDEAIKCLMELKSKVPKRKSTINTHGGV